MTSAPFLVPCGAPETYELPEPSRALGAAIHETFIDRVLYLPSGPIYEGTPVPAYTTSIDAAVSLCERVLPGWIWRLCSCHVSDDAWLCPDMGHPVHGALYDAAWPDCQDPLDDGPGLDTSYAPAGRPALALMAVLAEVVRGLARDEQPSVYPVALAMLQSETTEDHNYHHPKVQPMALIQDRALKKSTPDCA